MPIVINSKFRVKSNFCPVNKFGVSYKYDIRCDGRKCGETCECGGKGIRHVQMLKPHQIPVVEWMIEREANPISEVRGGINAMEMGLGKTLCTLTLIMRDYSFKDNRPEYPTLIVCPVSGILTWQEQIEKFFGVSCPHLILYKNKKINSLSLDDIKKYKIVIINYETVRSIATKNNIYDSIINYDYRGRKSGVFPCKCPLESDVKSGASIIFNIPWTRIVADEGHKFNNPTSALFYSMMSLYSKYKWTLSGTPLRNYSTDLYSQFRFLGFNKIFNSRDFSVDVYNKNKLNECILYMTKEDADIVLPDKKVETIDIELENTEREFYDHFLTKTKHAINLLLSKRANFSDVLALFLRLRQTCVASNSILYNISDHNEFFENNMSNLEDRFQDWISDVNSSAGINSSKIKATMKIIQNIPQDEKIIIFTTFKGNISILEKALKINFPEIDYEVVNGAVTGDSRKSALERFKNISSKRVLLLSYGVGSESLNITEASNIILLETVWTPSIIDQASSRSHRVGQSKNVIIYKLIAKNTIEERMETICQNKRELFNKFISKKSDGLTTDMIINLVK